MRELSGKREDAKTYMHLVRQQSEELERVLATDSGDLWSDVDAAWDIEGLRNEQVQTPDQSSQPDAKEA